MNTMTERHDDPGAPAADRWVAAVVTQSTDFEAFVVEVLPKVLRLARRVTVSSADAEDVAAEALARAYASWGRVGALPYRDGWVLRTTANLLCDRARRRSVAGRVGVEVTVPGFEQMIVDRAELVDALRHLSKRQRQAVVLHYLGGLSVDEASTVMRASPNSIKQHLVRGLAGLRQRLEPTGEEQSDV